MRILSLAKDPHFIGKTVQNAPKWPFSPWGCLFNILKVVGDSITFSTQRAAYVASLAPLDMSKVEIPLISPIVPIEIKSS